EPLPMQPPLAARGQQAIGAHEEQSVLPTRPLPARRHTLAPNPIELQLLPKRKRQPAGPPLPRPAQPQRGQLQANDRGVRHNPFAAILGKQRQRLRSIDLLVHHLDRSAPSQCLRVVDLAQMKDMLLHDASARDALVLDDAPIAMPLAVLLANLVAQKHDGSALFTDPPPGKYPGSALQPFSAAAPHRARAISIAYAIKIRENRQRRCRIGQVRLRRVLSATEGSEPPENRRAEPPDQIAELIRLVGE